MASVAEINGTVRGADDATDRARLRALRLWLFSVAGLVFVMILVGGATRLTDSGLSITEWKPVTGALLPFSEAAWLAEFEKYKQIPQYQLLNQGMSLAAFKHIYLWEWGHRFLGRLIGAAYLLPLLVFVAKGWVRGRFLAVLLGIGVLGGLQGAIGWIMVASGLKPGMTAVAPVKLMAHLMAASAIFVALIWVAVGLKLRPVQASERRLAFGASLVLAIVLVQIALGALVAGLDAGLAFNTWPLMDGGFAPQLDTLLPIKPLWLNVIESIAAVQFNHRLGAYVLLAVTFWHVYRSRRIAPDSPAARRAAILAMLVVIQAGIGIVTLLLVVPVWAGLLHQGFAMLLLGHATAHRRLLVKPA